MSERAPHLPEQEHSHEQHNGYDAEKQQEIARNRLEKAAESVREKSEAEVDSISEKAEKRAQSSEDLKQVLEHQTHDQDSQKAYSHTAPEMMPRLYAQARKQLKPMDRTISKVVHNPKIEAVSNVAGSTVARPSGFLYGALFSFIATLLFLVVSKRYGYEYNAFIGILAFVGGFFFGLIVEFAVRALKHPAKKT
jgi:phosphohistidine phosphatase SixA